MKSSHSLKQNATILKLPALHYIILFPQPGSRPKRQVVVVSQPADGDEGRVDVFHANALTGILEK